MLFYVDFVEKSIAKLLIFQSTQGRISERQNSFISLSCHGLETIYAGSLLAQPVGIWGETGNIPPLVARYYYDNTPGEC